MPIPLIVWGVIALGAGGYAMSQTADAAEQSAKLARWVAIGGGLYVSYRALQATGALK